MIEFIKNLDTDELIKKIKPLAIASVCFTAVFVAGFGVGKSTVTNSEGSAKRSLNYTTSTGGEQNPDNLANANGLNNNSINKAEANSNQNKSANPNNNTNAQGQQADCNIKGSKSKIYHVPGGAFYDRTTAAVCFNTEEEAQAAGYTKSAR